MICLLNTIDYNKIVNGRYCVKYEKLYNETERHYNAHYNNTKQYYSNQHYNKADNKDPKQNVIERKTERKHFA